MSWPLILAGGLVAIAVVLLGRLMRCWLSNPAAAMEMSSHDAAQFAHVMAGRYAFMAAMLIGAALLGGLGMVAFVFASLAALGFYDAWIYHRADKKAAKHLQAGVASLAAALACLGLIVAQASNSMT